MEVVWTDTALADVEAIYGYISRFNPHAAAEVALALRDAGDSLTSFPERGRGIGHRRRELLVVWPYAIRYRIAGDRVLILRVRHGARAPE